jgi:hypothetical protein
MIHVQVRSVLAGVRLQRKGMCVCMYVVCGMWYVQCGMLFSYPLTTTLSSPILCPMPYALCPPTPSTKSCPVCVPCITIIDTIILSNYTNNANI